MGWSDGNGNPPVVLAQLAHGAIPAPDDDLASGAVTHPCPAPETGC